MRPAVASTGNAAATDPVACLACDVGGSSVKAGLVATDGTVTARVRRTLDSQGTAGPILDGLAAAITEVHGQGAGRPVGLGLAVPGPFDERRGAFMIRGQHKFESLYGVELLPELIARAPFLDGLPVRFVNDAAAFALGELAWGAAQGLARAMFLTLGTGCGSAFSVGARLVTDGPGVPANGYVYDLPFGESVVDDYLSRRGLLRLWRERGGDAGLDVSDIAALARAENEAAGAVFAQFGHDLATALAPVVAEFAPAAIVTGGRIAHAHDLFAPAARAEFAARGLRVQIVPAARLGDSALCGAASLLLGVAA